MSAALSVAACGGAAEGEEELGEPGAALEEGQPCGGIGNIQCPEGQVCVDNPNDLCDPRTGSDCGGICVVPESDTDDTTDSLTEDSCAEDDESKTYVLRDPLQCQAALFVCAEGSEPFFDDCGCGCLTY